MKRIFTYIMFICVLNCAALESSILTELNANNDHGIWFDERVHFDLTNNLEFFYRSEQRLGANYKKFWFYDYEGVLQYNLIPYLPECFNKFSRFSFGPGFNFTQQFLKNTKAHYEWVWINRSVLEAKVTFELFEWTIDQRMRGEYWDYTKKHNKDYGLYRHRIIAYSPWKFTCLQLNPFIHNEWFFRNKTYSSSHTSGLVGPYYENRFRVGFQATFSDKFSAAFEWQWRASKQKPSVEPRWFNTYQYCIDLYFRF